MDDLERALADLGTRLDLPIKPDVAPIVRRRIVASPARRRFARPLILTRRSIAFAVALALVASGIAVASYFGVRGVRVRVGETPPPSPGVGAPLNLGDLARLEEAQRSVSFPVRVPALLGPPDEVYIGRGVPGYAISLLYRPRADLPEAAGTGAGVLLLEFQASLNRPLLEKSVGSADRITQVTVGGSPGMWIEGTHTVAYVRPDGEVFEDTVRLAGNVLLWQLGSVTFRLESALPMDAAIRLAESVR